MVGFETMQSVEIPDALNRFFVIWDGTQIVEDPVQKQKYLDDAWMFVRIERNNRLQKCDWTHCTDAQLSDEKRAEWVTYRQALRDLPTTVTDPTNVTWPTPPN